MVYQVAPLLSNGLDKNNNRGTSASFPSIHLEEREVAQSIPFATGDLAMPPAACSKERPFAP